MLSRFKPLLVVVALITTSLISPLSGAHAAPVKVPGKVLSVKVASVKDSLKVSWRKGSGGKPTSYTATLTPSGKKCISRKTSCTFTKLTNGVNYKISIVAKNSAGLSRAVKAKGTVNNTTETSVSLSLSSQSTFVNTAITATATLSPTTTGGTIAFTVNGSTYPSCANITVVGNQASCSISQQTVGAYNIGANYSGNGIFLPSNSEVNLLSVVVKSTSLALTSSQSPASPGQSTILTAAISPVPDGGTVSFTSGGISIPSCTGATVNTSTGQATCQYIFTSAGSPTVAASYSGSTNYSVSSSSIDITVNKITTSMELTSSEDPEVVGQSTTLTSSITPIPDGGTVTFSSDGTSIPSCIDVAVDASTGQATCQYIFASAGPQGFAATYSGSANYFVSSSSIGVVVNRAATSHELTSSNTSLTLGQSTTLTSSITPIPDGGTVTFSSDGTSIPSCTDVTVNTSTGQAACQYVVTSTGTPALAAIYSGSSNFSTSSSSSIGITVSKVVTSHGLTSSKTSLTPGQSTTLTSSITPVPDGGTVTFSSDGTSIPSCIDVTVDTTTGQATCTWSAEPFQDSNLSATYSGTAAFATSASNAVAQKVKLQTVSFTNPGVDTFTVPSGWTKILVTAAGAQGAANYDSYYGSRGAGGYGGRVNAILDVIPGQVLQVKVGAVGGANNGLSGNSNGAWSSGAGGGATSLTSGACTLESLGNCLAIAGAGGGGGSTYNIGCWPATFGGSGGALWNGNNFGSGEMAPSVGCGIRGATAPGGGGGSTASTALGYNGTFGSGGVGAKTYVGGGGGGDGFWGGAGGGILSTPGYNFGSGGGGGSSYVTTASTQFTFTGGAQAGNGSLSISNMTISTNTSTSLSLSNSTIGAGAPIIATATISPTTNGGTVAFWVAGSIYPSCSAVVVIGGKATCSISKSNVGTYTIQASYSGVGITLPSNSSVSSLDVDVNIPAVSLASSESAPVAGRTITLTANVHPIPDGGTVTFFNNNVSLNNCVSVPVDLSTGNANCLYTFTSTASNSFTASYYGTTNFSSSNTTTGLVLIVSKAATTHVLTSSKNPVGLGQRTTLTSTIGPVPDGGTVTFKSDDIAIASCTAVPVNTTTGIATCSWLPDPYQDSSVSATYSGTESFSASTSNTVEQKVS